VDKYRPIYYAGASGDFNPIHIDPAFAKNVGLEGNILQGLCTMAWVSMAVTSWTGDIRSIKTLKGRFSKPVRPEDMITITGRIVSIEGTRIKIEISANNQKREQVISHAFAEVELPD